MHGLKKSARFLALLIVCALALSLSAGALELEAFPDGVGHWAEPYLRRAVAEGLLSGNQLGLLAPDEPATMAQTLTILCRLLWPDAQVRPEDQGVPAGTWYAGYAAAARAMEIDFGNDELESLSFPRARAFNILAQAFRLIPAQPDYAALDAFSDAGTLADADRPAAAALVAAGYVNGSAGRLNPYASVSRAELVTMILRIAEATLDAPAEELPGAAVLLSTKGLSGKTLSKTVWLACGAGETDLRGVKAGTVVVLAKDAAVLTDARTDIERLVLAGGAGDSLSLEGGHVGTLVIAPGAPESVTVRNADRVELTADGHTVTVSSADALAVSGRGNTVTVAGGANAALTLTDRAEDNTVTAQAYLSRLELDGEGNTVTAAGGCAAAVVGGHACALKSGTYIWDLTVASRSAKVDVPGAPQEAIPTDARGLWVELEVPETFDAAATLPVTLNVAAFEKAACTLTWTVDGVPAGYDRTIRVKDGENDFSFDLPLELFPGMSDYRRVGVVLTYPGGTSVARNSVVRLTNTGALLSGAAIDLRAADHNKLAHVTASATVLNPVSLTCLASWYADGQLVESRTVTVGPNPVTVSLDRDLGFRPADSTGSLELRLTLNDAAASARTAAKLNGVSPEYALSVVTHDYAGDYTLEWAQTHDYDAGVKTVWINAKGYASDTPYIIWVNRTYQRVNIFEGSQGNWRLVKTFLCGTGRAGHATPVSVSKVRQRLVNGWTHSTYIVRPVVYFLTGGYAFHSRLWNPSHTALKDPSIGYPISLGCVRMYDEDVQWIFDYIPEGTTVVVH